MLLVRTGEKRNDTWEFGVFVHLYIDFLISPKSLVFYRIVSCVSIVLLFRHPEARKKTYVSLYLKPAI